MLKLYNTLTRKKEDFKPLNDKRVGIYTCGPTVYWYAHIGNMRTYISEDILKRVLEFNGFKVKHVMNITDVGHLVSDADTGEDKMEKGAKREGKTAWVIAQFYTEAFKKDLKLLNIKEPDIWIKATDTIKEQIDLIKILEKKGFTYQITDGIYFDTKKLKTYGALWGKKQKKLKAGARVEMVKGKKNLTDFALWKLTPKGVKRQMEWDSPWGKGFPGWHTECVVMSIKELGIPFDIHCGGIDHIPIHHTNEIAQAEAAYNKIFARYWMHGEFLVLKEDKMAKSKGNVFLINDLIKKGFNPLAFRYLCLNSRYNSQLTFSFEALISSHNALDNLYQRVLEIKTNNTAKGKEYDKYLKEFKDIINDDLNTPEALALMWNILKDKKVSNQDKYLLALEFDKVFGLNLKDLKQEEIPMAMQKLAEEREVYRKKGDWKTADEIRNKFKQLGYSIEDTDTGPKIKRSG